VTFQERGKDKQKTLLNLALFGSTPYKIPLSLRKPFQTPCEQPTSVITPQANKNQMPKGNVSNATSETAHASNGHKNTDHNRESDSRSTEPN
jgi:hypothetical protein